MQRKNKISWLPLKAGCISILIALIAISIGAYLDYINNTAPRWTLILLLSSAPITFSLIIFIIRRALGKERNQSTSVDEQEEDN